MATDWNIGQLLSISNGYWKGCAVQAAVRLRFFSHLGSEKKSVGEVAAGTDTDTRGAGLLLDALSAMGLVEKEGGKYKNSEFAEKFLVASSQSYLGHIILHHHHILDGWAQLDRAVRTGRKVERRTYGEEIERESFLMGMFNLASIVAPQICSRFPLKGRKKLLDLGGGPGTYAIHFCLKNPELSGVVFDRPTTEPFAKQTVAKHGLSDRIDFAGGDFNTDPIPGGPYDVVWMSHILHSNSYEQCERFIAKAAKVLEVGGLLMIHDFILNDEKDSPEFPALFSLNMLVGTESGRSYSRPEVIAMVKKCGFEEIEQFKLPVQNDSSIIVGIKKTEDVQ